MNREELKDKIDIELFPLAEPEKIYYKIVLDKIMLLIDSYIESREKEKLPSDKEAWLMEVESNIMNSRVLIEKLQRNGWELQLIHNEIEPFCELNYPERHATPQTVLRHFFNSMNKRKPENKSGGAAW